MIFLDSPGGGRARGPWGPKAIQYAVGRNFGHFYVKGDMYMDVYMGRGGVMGWLRVMGMVIAEVIDIVGYDIMNHIHTY